MRMRVSVRDKQLLVNVGVGVQSLRWLANAAMCRYDNAHGMELGNMLYIHAQME